MSRLESNPCGVAETAVRNAAGGLDQTKLLYTCSSSWQPGADVSVEASYPYEINLLGFVAAVRPPDEQDDGACGMTRLRSPSRPGDGPHRRRHHRPRWHGRARPGRRLLVPRPARHAGDRRRRRRSPPRRLCPGSTGEASAVASDYLAKNGGGNSTVTFSTQAHRERQRDRPRLAPRARLLREVLRRRLGRRRRDGDRALRGPPEREVGRPDRGEPQAPAAQLRDDERQADAVLRRADAARPHRPPRPGSRDAAGSFGLINLDRANGGNIGARPSPTGSLHGLRPVHGHRATTTPPRRRTSTTRSSRTRSRRA